MESTFAIGFYIISYFKLNPLKIVNVLQLLENEAEDLPTDTIPLDFIAPLIHQIYTSTNTFIRCSTLRLISFFEMNSTNSIIEKYQFDKLICMSIEQKPPDPPLKIDEEKVGSFRIVLLLIKMRNSIPVSIVRSLVSLYNTPKHTYHNLIIAYLCQGILLCDDFPDVPEVSKILVDYLIESGDKNIIDFFGRIFEKQYIFMNYDNFASKVLCSLSGAFNQIVRLDFSSSIVIQLLGTWPGLFCLGVRYKALFKLIRTLPHFQTTIVKIFTKLLLLNGPKMSVLSGFTGYLLYYLIKNNLIDLLTSLNSTNSETLTFLDQLIFHTSHYNSSFVITKENVNRFFNKGQILVSNNISYNKQYSALDETPLVSSPLLKISQCLSAFSSSTSSSSLPSSQVSSTPSLTPIQINTVQIPTMTTAPPTAKVDQISIQSLLDDEEMQWAKVHVLFTVVLSHDYSEANSPLAYKLYSKILAYFSSRQLSDFPRDSYVITSECVFALMDLLVPHGDNNHFSSFLLESKDFLLAIVNSLNLIMMPNLNIDDHHPVWSIIECFCRLITDPIGIEILNQQKVPKLLDELGKKFAPTKSVMRLLKMIRFSPEASLSTLIYSLFLMSTSSEVVKMAVNELRNKIKTTPNFFKQQCLENTLLKLIKSSPKNYLALNLLCELILSNDECLEIVSKDPSLYPIIMEYSRETYSVLLRYFDAGSKLVDDEIEFWMNKGIYDYVETFDKAVLLDFEEKTEPIPSLIIVDNHAIIPPHIFGQLSKNHNGFLKLSSKIPLLLNMCKDIPERFSIKKKRAAFFALGHFCSVEGAATAEIVQTMISSALNSESCMLIGTLINCLSLVRTTQSINEVLSKNGFAFFEFGGNMVVVPSNPELIVNDSLHYIERWNSTSNKDDIVDSQNGENDANDWPEPLENVKLPSKIAVQFPLLLNPIHQNLSTQMIFKASTGEIRLDEQLLTTQNAMFAHELLANSNFIPTARKFVFDIFRSTPLMEQRNDIINQRVLAECLARAEEATNASPNMLASSGFSNIQLEKLPPEEIKNKKHRTPFPEVYLKDEDFARAAGVPDRKTFYSLPHEQQTVIRNKLLS